MCELIGGAAGLLDALDSNAQVIDNLGLQRA
jgi:hypothetical protein